MPKTKTKEKDFTLATPHDAPEDEEQKDTMLAALGEQPHERDARHVIQVAQSPNLVLEGDPEKQVEFAQKAARALMGIIQSKPKKVIINNEQYIEFEDWQILGRFYGATVGTEWTHRLVRDDKTWGYESRAVVYRNGEAISAAEAMCTRDERNWAKRDEFMLRSMAQTRASAKALRNAFAWVAVMAGLKPTPAEEMDGDYPDPPQKSSVATQERRGNTKPAQGGSSSTHPPQKTDKPRIAEHLEELGIDWKNADVARAAIKSITQLEPTEDNFPEIEARLAVRVEEQREAKAEAERLKNSNAAPVK